MWPTYWESTWTIVPFARLHGKINKNGPVSAHRPDLGRCWLWRGKPGSRGYGYFWFEGKKRLAHRFSYEAFVGPIPDGLVIDHLCRVPMCVNPNHLEPVTDQINILRGEGHAARNVLKDTCGMGHLFDETNTYWYPDGSRGYRTCRQAHWRKWRDKHIGTDRVPHGERTHCPQGHEYTSFNTRVRPKDGARICIECTRARDRELKRAKRARDRAARIA